MQRLRPVQQFAKECHRGRWSVSDFPSRIGARVVVDQNATGGHILGMACRSDRGAVIGLDERIFGTRLYVPVLAHEVSHLLLGGSGTFQCSSTAVCGSSEQDAWFGAAMLAVSARLLRRIDRGTMSPMDIAARCSVPLEMVNLAWAVHAALDDHLAVSVHAAHVALTLWEDWLDRATHAPLII